MPSAASRFHGNWVGARRARPTSKGRVAPRRSRAQALGRIGRARREQAPLARPRRFSRLRHRRTAGKTQAPGPHETGRIRGGAGRKAQGQDEGRVGSEPQASLNAESRADEGQDHEGEMGEEGQGGSFGK